MSKPKYTLNEEGLFCIEKYNQSKVFSNFFPGIAGLWGTPMWVFYVNRGQGIASFGIESKDKAIMEFQPANKAYRQTALQGFRTFIKATKGTKESYWEPFQDHIRGTHYTKTQTMDISSHDLTLQEKNETLGLEANVNYFTLPNESLAALVRKVTLTNTSKTSVKIDLIDGLPLIIPYGQKDWLNKNMARTVEAWVKVRNVNKKAAYYQLNVEVADTPRVTHINEGNFFYSFPLNGSKSLATPIVEASQVFGSALAFLGPDAFLNKNFALSKKQNTESKSPCAMARYTFTLKPGASFSFASLVGYAPTVNDLNKFVAKSQSKKFIDEKAQANKDIIDQIKSYALTNSSSQSFDLYSQSTFLDNILRGGLPVTVSTKDGDVAFNVYSRKHGDLERDYNFFTVAPTFYSQGNGNYRDVNQNRRNDIFFNTDVQEGHLINFLNLSQADGYNPLVVRGTSFSFKEEKDIDKLIGKYVKAGDKKDLRFFMAQGFLPGDLLVYIDKNKIKLSTNMKNFLSEVLSLCTKQELATHGEGFWSDHWTYNLDLIESYMGVYPERLKYLLLECHNFNFYLNHHYVLPRNQRYILTPYGVRQYNSVVDDSADFNPEIYDNKLRVKGGEGGVYETHLLCKLLCLIANKTATLDPSGVGIEMEGDKPNWYDALNGLPGLLGSSISETMELKRCAQFALDAFKQLELEDTLKVEIFEELATFVSGLSNILKSEKDTLSFWNKSNDVKENYRQRVRRSISGETKLLTIRQLREFLQLVVVKTTQSFKKAQSKDGHLATYFFHEVTDYKKNGKEKNKESFVQPNKFKRHNLPLFLEGYVHALKTAEPKTAAALYKSVCSSGLYDKKLKMFKVNEDLSSQTEEIGRTRIFPRGWLENESVWLHMEYKFMLELLRSGLHEEYYKNLPNVLVAFLKPDVYGRSILENSSFIVSSAHEDKGIHGQGFVARLSGSTAEFLHMWLYMNVGAQPFKVDPKGKLILQFDPVLDRSLFTTKPTSLTHIDGTFKRTKILLPKNSYTFKFLGKVLVVYHNPKRKSTYGSAGVHPKFMECTYAGSNKKISIQQAYLEGGQAEEVRSGKISRIDVHLA